MRRWIIAGAALVLAAAVGVTVWLLSPSDNAFGYPSPRAAVRAMCGAHASHPARSVPYDVWRIGPEMDLAYVRAQRHGGVFWMVWTNKGPGIHYAEVRRTAAGRNLVVACYRYIGG
jgi:hypothetical protein